MKLIVVKQFEENRASKVKAVVFCVHGEWQNMYGVSSLTFPTFKTPTHPISYIKYIVRIF